jgi:hypothetical protein
MFDKTPIMPNTLMQLDKVRALYRGRRTRRFMAVLQQEHIAAAKIQLAYMAHSRRRSAAARVLQAAFRVRLFQDFLRGIREAKQMVLAENSGDDGRQVPQPSNVILSFPLLPARQDAHLSPPEKQLVARHVINVLARALNIPRDIILCSAVADSSAGFSVTVALPHRVRHLAQPLVEQIFDPHSIWEPVFRSLVQKEQWRFVVPRSSHDKRVVTGMDLQKVHGRKRSQLNPRPASK